MERENRKFINPLTMILTIILIAIISLDAILLYTIFRLNEEISSMYNEIMKIQKSYTDLSLQILSSLYDDYGGVTHLHGNATGFFHVEKIYGKFWLVDPEGNLFISKGVNHVDYWGDYSPPLGYSPYNGYVSEKYGSADKWAEEAVSRLRKWGFNTIGAWSSRETYDKGMPYTIILNIALNAGASWLTGNVADYFSREFEETAEKIAREECAPRREDRHLIGYFIDNELRWAADWRSSNELFDDYMLLPPEAEGKKALVKFLREKYGEISSLNRVWGTSFSSFDDLLLEREAPKVSAVDIDRRGFLRIIAEQYFKLTYNIIKKYDPNHLILGCRFAYKPPNEVLYSCIGYTDVLSVNCYTNPYSNDLELRIMDLKEIYRITCLPIMITEFSFKAMDSGLPNSKGAGVPVKTQAERAKYYEEYAKAMIKQPFIIGYHWFQYSDQPYEGRFDGENSNFGLVTIRDEPWETLVQKATIVNLEAELAHLKGEE
ncbi:beta-galactosidase [Candidatus Bathyarchaeota archaeon]|nr:beta-galactosidase [Candidatus Bathyarchaeota archaeon]